MSEYFSNTISGFGIACQGIFIGFSREEALKLSNPVRKLKKRVNLIARR
jgi:hypothetical protein